MQFITDKFPAVDIDSKGFYDILETSVNGKAIQCGLNISEDLIGADKAAEQAKSLINKLDKLDILARECIADDLENDGGTTAYYMEFHLEEVDEIWEELFPGVEISDITAAMIVPKLQLNSVGIHVNAAGEAELNLDYVINFDYSDELLAVYFDKDGNIITYAHES